MKRILTLVVMVIAMQLAIVIDKGVAGLVAFWNAPSLVIVLVIPISMLILSGTLQDFLVGLKFAVINNSISVKQLKASRNAYDLGIKLVMLSAVFGSMTGFVNLLSSLDDPSAIGPALAIALLTIYYAVIINMFLYGIRSKIKRELINSK